MYHPSHPKSAIADAAPALHDPDHGPRSGRNRRGFFFAALALALGTVALPFLPGKKNELDPNMLHELDLAKANKKLLRDLSLAFYQHPNAVIRFQCARAMQILISNPKINGALWHLVENDPIKKNRHQAACSLVHHTDESDIPRLVELYYGDPALQPTIDRAIEFVGFDRLRAAIEAFVDH